jgi:hypothetical protein
MKITRKIQKSNERRPIYLTDEYGKVGSTRYVWHRSQHAHVLSRPNWQKSLDIYWSKQATVSCLAVVWCCKVSWLQPELAWNEQTPLWAPTWPALDLKGVQRTKDRATKTNRMRASPLSTKAPLFFLTIASSRSTHSAGCKFRFQHSNLQKQVTDFPRSALSFFFLSLFFCK